MANLRRNWQVSVISGYIWTLDMEMGPDLIQYECYCLSLSLFCFNTIYSLYWSSTDAW